MLHYKECGLSTVWLVNGYAPHAGSVHISDSPGLHRLIAKTLLRRRSLLAGREMVFLRREMRLRPQDLAVSLGIAPALVCQWEQGPHPLPRYADLALRALYAGTLLEKSESELHFHLVSESPPHCLKERLMFTFGDRHWRDYVAAAANTSDSPGQ